MTRILPRLEALEPRCLLDSTYHPLLAGDFWQDWSDTSLLNASNNWDAVPSVIGYRGDGLTGSTGIDPQTVLAFAGPGGPVINVLTNQTNPDGLTSGGVAEFELLDPVVGLQGSATARAPALVLHLDATGMADVTFYLELRDLDGSADNALSQVAIQFRLGTSGPFTNLPKAYIADASEGPKLSGLVTPVYVTLPPEANYQPQLQLRIITTDAAGSDEWIGVDTIYVTGTPSKPPSNDTLRIVTYNITSSGNLPRTGLETVLYAVGQESYGGVARPLDILALQEIRNQVTTTEYVVGLMNGLYGAGVYARGQLNGATTGSGTQGIVYNTQTLTLLGEATVGTASSAGQPRQALRYHFRPAGTSGEADFYLYNSHFKATNDQPSRDRRLIEANALRANADALGEGTQVLFVGDFNLYTSNEPAYQRLLATGAAQMFDPLNRPGNWHSSSGFRDIMTQAPSNNPPPGLIGGGLDDRFDFQLLSAELSDDHGFDYRASSYHTFGVNGSVPLNGSVNDPRNTAIPELPNRLEVLELLTTVTDHLPVVADFRIWPASAPYGRGVQGQQATRQTDADFVATLRLPLVSPSVAFVQVEDGNALVTQMVYFWDEFYSKSQTEELASSAQRVPQHTLSDLADAFPQTAQAEGLLRSTLAANFLRKRTGQTFLDENPPLVL